MVNPPSLEEQLRALVVRITDACPASDSYIDLTYSTCWSTRFPDGPCRVTIEIGKPMPTVRASAKTFDEAADKAAADFLRVMQEPLP